MCGGHFSILLGWRWYAQLQEGSLTKKNIWCSWYIHSNKIYHFCLWCSLHRRYNRDLQVAIQKVIFKTLYNMNEIWFNPDDFLKWVLLLCLFAGRRREKPSPITMTFSSLPIFITSWKLLSYAWCQTTSFRGIALESLFSLKSEQNSTMQKIIVRNRLLLRQLRPFRRQKLLLKLLNLKQRHLLHLHIRLINLFLLLITRGRGRAKARENQMVSSIVNGRHAEFRSP